MSTIAELDGGTDASQIFAGPRGNAPALRLEQVHMSEQSFVLSLEATVFNREQLRTQLEALAGMPQIALAGRSNVGKSSLVNALARRRQLAKTSATPGKTRSINFYRVNAQPLVLADLPGYGYARCSQSERKSWAKLIEWYLTDCPALKALALLVDCRIPPQVLDRDLADFAIARGLPVLPVLTKVDKCTQMERSRRQKEWAALLGGVVPILASAKDGFGLETLRKALLETARSGEAGPELL